MRKDNSWRRPERQELESRLPPGILRDAQSLGIWNMMLRTNDPTDVSHAYRSYRDSNNCTVPRQHLRAMRDVLIDGMKEMNRLDPKPRMTKRRGIHYGMSNNPYGRTSS